MAEIDQAVLAAIQHHQAGRLMEAEQGYRRALAVQPDHFDACHMLGMIAHAAGRQDAAADLIGRALRVRPADAVAHANLAIVLRAQGKFSQAAAECREAIRLKPVHPEAYINLGNVLTDLGEFDQAVEAYQQAIRFQPANPKTHTSLGSALSDAGRLDEAIAAHRRAIELAPDMAGAHWNLALAMLLSGDDRGWDEYEWRWKFDGFSSIRRNFPRPHWRGEDLTGRTILLHAEQGFGDTIQFSRYVAIVAARGGRVLLECQPQLKKLLEQLAGVERVIAAGETLPAFDVHCPLLSLPLALGTKAGSMSNAVPYLQADPEVVGRWASRLADTGNDVRVGLAWAGSSTHRKNRNRSFDVSRFAPLSAVKGARFYSLQKDKPSATATFPAGFELIDLTDQLRDFSDTAALIEHLDLVISADTAVAHLAGAMGKPAWVLLPFSPDWRWQLNRSDNPWYPTMRLLRQTAFGKWDEVIAAVADELARQVSDGSLSIRGRGNMASP